MFNAVVFDSIMFFCMWGYYDTESLPQLVENKNL